MIDVVLPALDEAAAVARVLASLPPAFRPIVVDNGSVDGTGRIAARLGATVVVEPARGFGAACWAGLRAASSDVVCFMDCDGSLDGADLDRVVKPVCDDRADLVLGARQPTSSRAWPHHLRIANHMLARVVSRRAGVRVSDLGPMRSARRLALLELGITDRRYGWPLEMVVRAARRGWRIQETPVTYRPRVGRSKVTGTARGTALTALDMMRAMR